MPAADVRWDKSLLESYEREVVRRANRALRRIAEEAQREIVTGFNPQSPAPPGEPPGVVSGDLRASLHAYPGGALEWVVAAGVPYAVGLEYGTLRMAARPFFLPAVERILQRDAGRWLRAVIEP